VDGVDALGGALRALRESRGLGLAEAARRAGSGKSTLFQWESGLRTPRAAPLDRLLDALEAPERLRARLVAQADPRHARIVLAHRPSGAPVEIGQVLRAMRLRRGMTQAEAARASGVAQGTFARWEGGGYTPDAASLHTVGFALGASPEETAALSAVRGDGVARPMDVESALTRAIEVRRWEEPLHEVLQLGLEADAWWRSMRDPRWDVVVTSAMAKRAFRYFLDGRLEEADATSKWAVRLARTPEARSEAVMALDVVESLARRRGDPPEATIRLAEAWAESIPVEDSPEGGSKAWAVKIAARGRAAAGDLKGAFEAMRPAPAWLSSQASGADLDYRVDFEMTDVFLLGKAPERALAFVDLRATAIDRQTLYGLILRANGQKVPEAWLMRLRAARPTVGVWVRRAIDRIERKETIRELGS